LFNKIIFEQTEIKFRVQVFWVMKSRIAVEHQRFGETSSGR